MTSRFWLIAAMATCFCGCQSFAQKTLEAELRSRSELEGFAIGSAISSTIWVKPFHLEQISLANPRRRGDGPGLAPGWFTSDGKHVIWWNLEGFILETLEGKEIGKLPGRFLSLQALAVSPDLSKIAFEATSLTTGVQTSGLHYGSFKEGIWDLAVREPNADRYYKASESLGWSTDNNRFVYERSGELQIYDVQTTKSTSLGAGLAPTWSPDGQWIAYKTSTREAMRMHPDGSKLELLTPGPILGFLHWSPDSKYLLFSENEKANRLSVLSLRDLAIVPVLEFGFKGGRDNGYGWLADFRRFCTQCRKY